MSIIKRALVVLSGGQDSTTCLAIACGVFGAANVSAVTFNYGQRHARELQAAAAVAQLCGVADRHETVVVGDLLAGKSPLTDHTRELEQYTDYASMDATIGDRVELTFVPMRNALFLTLAANRAAIQGAEVIYTGVCQQDNANYPDCRQSFILAQERTINEALGNVAPGRGRDFISIYTPLMNMSKAQSIRLLHEAHELALLAFTHTAYDGRYPPTGRDHATVLREQGFLEAGIPDPLIVRAWLEGHYLNLPQGSNYFSHEWGPGSANFGRLCDQITEYKTRLSVATQLSETSLEVGD